ncbi:MAG: peptidoglycan DD-metalloendopeptidase family protein [Porcipelethomonas sp.]
MNKKKSFLSGKGFYVALSLSVAMIGTACYYAYTRTAEDIAGRLQSSFTDEQEDSEQQAAEIQQDVPKAVQQNEESKVYSEAETEAAPEPTEAEEESAAESGEEQEAEAEETAKPQERKLVMPLEGDILNEFSSGELVKSKTTGAWQTHNGIDIKAAAGDAVSAADKGKVSAVDSDPLWGITVTIDHGNGIITRYCNLNEGVTVQVGQEVSSGEEIGAVGETADIESSEESHLHFEVLKNGSFVNPVDMM